ncbi:hypothetical protein T05_7672 [Trichinella murrelli]|uniref:Uncharacterized protein n=1 Tax=Trichinella murrelli TaxID=144512 RepID=A0A0V0T902_9BILA|nr:hypothetical protein T05_7672 [Trichinella murrelli]
MADDKRKATLQMESGNRAGGRQAEDTSAQRNPPVDDGPSSLGDDCPNNPVGVTNDPFR